MPKKNASKPPERPKKRRKPKYNSRQLTQHLRELAAEAETMDGDGVLRTRGEVLAEMIWKKALGYTEEIKAGGQVVESVYHKPESWAIQLIWERMEGRAPQAIPDDKGRQTAATKVDELVRSRINSIAQAVLTVPGSGGPVDLPDHGVAGPEGPDEKPGMAGEASGRS